MKRSLRIQTRALVLRGKEKRGTAEEIRLPEEAKSLC
jgi:hypothetical protein